MKTKTTILILFISLIFISEHLNAQGNPVKINLMVNTQEINQENINTMSNFGQPNDISNEEYTTNVRMGDMVIWQARSENGNGDHVYIKAIIYEDGTSLFESKRLTDNNTPGAVVGIIVNGNPGDYEKYIIKFEVVKRGQQSGNIYRIDPKLKLVPQE
ncbi:hypothetical protein [Gramella sp. MAR_2010_147]|uniref:hypothetical protein n=1 Tax=Gramella sp. MAR_2010_147 TaxID=1250205 RepID=UPI00087CF0C8|nr:hypothetical protein [Gramella sp. MAR_2010_147]SDS22554.1 hypothetical protein SAMN04488553_1766 [Gramella sp. MAR_2010_147]